MSPTTDAPQGHPRGRSLIVCSSLAVAAAVAATLLVYGAGEAGLRAVIRNTARTSFLLFTSSFVARPLCSLRRTRVARRLDENRATLYVSFAVSHLIHAAAIFALAAATRGASLAGRDAGTLAGGAFAYLIIVATAATYYGGASRRVESHEAARLLRSFGFYYVWLIFMISYGGRAADSLAYLPFAVVLVAAVSVRLLAAIVRPRENSDAAAPHSV